MLIDLRNGLFSDEGWITTEPKATPTTWYYRNAGTKWFSRTSWEDADGNLPSSKNPIGPGDSYVFDQVKPIGPLLFNPPTQKFHVKGITFDPGLSGEVTVVGDKTISGVESILNSLASDAAEKHHVFECPVECKVGVTPTIAAMWNSYIKFPGGLKAYALAQMDNLSLSSRYYCGNIELLTPNVLWTGNVYANSGKTVSSLTTRVFILSGSVFRVSRADLKWVTIESGATVIVDELVSDAIRFFGDNNGNRFMQNYKSWYAYWNRPVDTCNGVIYVRNKISFSRSDLFMPDGDDENRKMLFNGIENSSTAVMSGAYKGTPRVYLNTGYKTASSKAAVGTFHHEQPVNIALGSGGLKVVSGANGNACFQAWKSSRLQSFQDWEIAAHPTSGNAVVTIDSGVTLAIDTTHVVTGIPEIDVVDEHTVTVNGKINGAGHLDKSGIGTLLVNEPLGVTGGVTLWDGIMRFAISGNVISGAPLMVKGGAHVECGDATFKNIDMADNGFVESSGELTIAASSTITIRGFAEVPMRCATLAFADATATTIAFEADDVLENGSYVVASITGGVAPVGYASLSLTGSAISGKSARLDWDASESKIVLVIED